LLIPNGQHSSDSTLRLGLKLFHRLRSGAFGTPLADQQRKATRVYSPSRSALHGSQRLKRINQLIKDIMRNPFSGIGESEPLRHNWTGYWSRRIDREHRIVYKYEDEKVQIVKCRFHY
jgi:toxin YoeB